MHLAVSVPVEFAQSHYSNTRSDLAPETYLTSARPLVHSGNVHSKHRRLAPRPESPYRPPDSNKYILPQHRWLPTCWFWQAPQ